MKIAQKAKKMIKIIVIYEEDNNKGIALSKNKRKHHFSERDGFNKKLKFDGGSRSKNLIIKHKKSI